MRSTLRFLVIFAGLWALTGCGDDVVVKPTSDVFSGSTDDVQVAADTADDATATAGDVTSTGDSADAAPDADATLPPDAATAETSEDAAADDAADADVSPSDADAAADSAEPADATADATPVTDDAVGTDATADDAAVTDVADVDAGAADTTDVGVDAADGALSDTWTPCTSGVSCEDGDPCTLDLCWDVSCQHIAIVACAGPLAPCDALHACAAGVCDPVRNACVPCVTASDCGAGHACLQNACMPAIPCKSDVACKGYGQVCNKDAGVCADCVVDGDCGKGNQCIGSKCQAATPCGSSKDCPAVCNLQAGLCVDCMDAIDCGAGQACSNNHACVPATCKETTCAGTAAFACAGGGWSYSAGGECDDGNNCTTDSCINISGCKKVLNTLACDDGNACTVGDACASGLCTGAAMDCNDKNACTADSCAPTKGCQHAAAIGPCDDGTVCTVGDQCVDSVCTGKAISCEDGQFCTVDSCDSVSGCRNLPGDASPCDDNNACTVGTHCQDGACKGGTAVNCDDGQPCTVDACDGKGGCTHSPLTDKTACDDGDPCTLIDACATGVCKGAAIDCNDTNPCTVDSCVGGACKHTNVTGACDDNNGCTTGDACVAGACAGGVAVSCASDSKGCGNGVCKSTGSQSFTCSVVAQQDGTACDADGNGCTVNDACKAGACTAGATKDCAAAGSADGCQIGVCQSLSSTSNTCAVVAATIGTTCNADSNGCTAGDKCNALGACVPGSMIDCNLDPAYCTTGACFSTGATSYTCAGGANKPDGTTCNADNSGCTLDTCQGGKCQGGSAPDCSSATDKCNTGVCKSSGWSKYTCAGAAILCDDGNPCTNDFCQLPGGCTATANSAPCNDNNACTLSDTCSGGKCGSVTPAVCDDKNVCTVDSCDPVKGCIGTLISCDDGDACTVDTCDSAKGCLHTALTNCVTVGVPYVEPFNCGGATGWTLGQTVETTVGWGIDGTPAAPGYLSPLCSLNFNNGKDFQCVNPVDASAVSPVINAVNLPAGSHLALRFFNNGVYEAAAYDKMSVEITTNSGVNWLELLSIPAPANAVWTLQTIDLTPYVGKPLQLRFRFLTTDCILNDTAGGFIDDLAIYTTNCSATVLCDDKNACTTDVCDKLSGQCTFTANALVCNDGNACTASDACKLGVCSGTATNCDDGNACSLDACDGSTGKCTHAAIGDGTTCNDNNPCTTADACAGTSCVGGVSPCNDNNPCTTDICANLNGAASCSSKILPDTTPCNDGNACTAPDACTSGVCTGPDTCAYSTVYSETFACGATNNWKLQGVGTSGLAWAVDATPATPGYYSPSCSLNFNDGTTYGTVVPAVAFATSPSFVLPAKASACKLSLYSWSNVGMFNGETRAIALLDATTGLDLVTYGIASSVDANAWTPVQIDCAVALGHTVMVQLRFSDSAGPLPIQPNGAGWFVDDVQVNVAAP